MTFNLEPEVTRTPTRVRKLEIRLFKTIDPDDIDYPRGVDFSFSIDDQNNHSMNHRHGNMIPHLTIQEKTYMQAFFDKYWDIIEDDVLPGG